MVIMETADLAISIQFESKSLNIFLFCIWERIVSSVGSSDYNGEQVNAGVLDKILDLIGLDIFRNI
jgi:hypothetical protein